MTIVNYDTPSLQHGGSFRKYPSRKNIGCGRWLDRNRNTTFSPKFVTFPVFVQVSRCWGLLPLLIVSDFPSVSGASPSLVFFWQKQPAWPFRMKVVPHDILSHIHHGQILVMRY